MADSVSRFQAEVAAVMELLLKVAVMEITKVFEGRSVVSKDCAPRDLHCLPGLEAFGERGSRSSDKAVRSVGVQAGDDPDESNMLCVQDPHTGEGPPPTENPPLDLEETIDLQCTVDLPCNMFKEEVAKGDDMVVETVFLGAQAELSTLQNGSQSPGPVHDSLPSLSDSSAPDIPSTHLFSKSLDQSGLAMKETISAKPVTELSKEELLEEAVSTGERNQALDDGLLNAIKTVRSELSQTPFNLKPCSVQLVNLLQISAAKKRMTRIPAGWFKGLPKDLRTHQHVHTGRRLCCFTECGDGVWCLLGRRSLSCKVCGKRFKRRKILRRHERFHTGEKPYSCPKCPKMFALRKSLRRHERFHTGERPHSCPQCSKCFRLRDNLRAHMRFHTGEKPFTCSLCMKQFRIEKNLHKHASVHSGGFFTVK